MYGIQQPWHFMNNDEIIEKLERIIVLIHDGVLDVNEIMSDEMMEKYRGLKAKQNERHQE